MKQDLFGWIPATTCQPPQAWSSSSSGLSALVKACNRYYDLGLTQEELAQKAKFASGSSSRSFFGPLAAWDKESGEIYKVQTDLKLAMIMLVLNDKQKPVSSREGMKRCMETSTNFKEWIEESRQDYKDMLGYLVANDFERVGHLTERNALAMHATTRTATPAFSYLTEESHKAMTLSVSFALQAMLVTLLWMQGRMLRFSV